MVRGRLRLCAGLGSEPDDAVHAHGARYEPNHVRSPPASQKPKTASPPLPPLSGRFTWTNLRFDLHTNATEQCLVEARRRFDAQLFRESAPHLKELKQALREHDAALSMGVDVALGPHTVTVFVDGPQPFVRAPGRRGFHAISGPARHRQARRFGPVRREIMARCFQTR